MPDPQWCETEAEDSDGEIVLHMARGNHLMCSVNFDEGPQEPWTFALYDQSNGECLALNDGLRSIEVENGEADDACYPPRGHDALLHLTGPNGASAEIPLTFEEEESAMCLIGSPAPANETPAVDPNPTPERGPDELLLVLEGSPKVRERSGRMLETTVENLEKFLVEQRTNYPGAVQDLKTVVQHLREFGAKSFYVKTYYTKSAPKGRPYIIFKGNPQAPGKFFGRREIITSFGKYSFENPKIAQLGFGTKNALKSGAKATVISFVIVAAMDVYQEILEDEVSLSRLGITLAVDVVKLAISMLAGVGVGALLLGASIPVVAVAGAGLIVGLAVGMILDEVDNRLGLTEWLRKRAYEIEKDATESVRSAVGSFLWQLDWCARHPYQCFR